MKLATCHIVYKGYRLDTCLRFVNLCLSCYLDTIVLSCRPLLIELCDQMRLLHLWLSRHAPREALLEP